MADRSLAVRLAVKDAPQVLAALKATFGEGSNIVRSFQQQLEPTNRDLQRLENRLDSVARGTRAFAADEAKLGQLLAADRISLQRHNELLELSRQRYIAGASAARTHAAAMAGAKQAADAHTGAVRLQAYQVNNLFQQLQDVAVQLQGGTNPFTILVQQGPQATSAVGGVSNAVALLRAAISPTTVVALALAGSLGVLTARAAANESAIRAVAVGLQATGRTGQITAQQIDGAIDTMARLPNVTRAAARDLAALWGANPNIGPARFQQLAASVSDFATALRVDIPAAGAAFDKAMTSPTQTLIELDKQLDLKVSPSLLDTARRLEAVGLKAGAQAILLDALRPRLAGLAETAQGPLARALDGVKKNYDELMDSLADTTPVQASLAALQGWLGVLNQIVKLGPVNLGALVNPTVVAQALITGKVPGEKETVPRTRIDTSDVEADLARVRRQLQDTQRAAADLSALMERGPGGGREAEAAWQRQTDEAERYRREIEDLTRKIRDLVQAREAAATAPPMATAFASRAAGDDELGIPPGFYESASGGQSGSQERKITAEQINAAIDAYNPLAAQLRELKDKEEILRIGLERLNEEIAKGGKAAEDAAKRHAAGALALEQNIAQQKALKTSAQQAAEQAQVEIRVSRVAQGERERARVAAQAQLEAEHRGMRVDEQRVYVASKISEWEARKAAALRDSADAASLETVEALKVAAAWEGGAGAANLATAAMQARLAKLRDASIDEEEYTQRLLDQAAAQQLIAGGKAVDDLRQLVAAQSAVAAAAGLSAEAQAEVARQNEVAKFSAEQLAKATDGTREAAQKQIASYDELTKKRLADTQAAERQKAVQQALTTAEIAGAKAHVASLTDPAARRAGELEIERLQEMIRLQKLYKAGLDDPDARRQLALFDAAQASRELERFYNDQRTKAEGWANDVSQFLVDGFVNAGEGGKSVFDNLWDGALQGAKRLVANIAAEFLKQQFILPITTAIVGSAPGLFGITPPQSASNSFSLVPDGRGGFSITQVGGAANSLTGGSLFKGVGDGLGLNTLLGNEGGFLGLPTFGQGFSTLFGSGAVSSAASSGTLLGAVGLEAAESAGLGAFVAGGGIDAAAGASAAAASGAAGVGTFASIASVALPVLAAAAVAIPLISSFFKGRPSNKGAEFTFGLGDGYPTLYEGTKHAEQRAYVKGFAEPIQQTLDAAVRQFGVTLRGDGAIGANVGAREGLSFFYDGAGGIADRQVFQADKGDEASIAAATEGAVVAALKDADWSESGEAVATAVANSSAESLADFSLDVAFAKGFEKTVEFLNKGWDPLTSQMAQIGQQAKEAGDAATKTIRDFLDKTAELWPPVVRSFDEAGNEIVATTREVTSELSAAYGQTNTEADQAVTSLMDAAGTVYSFTGALGDATLQLTSATGEVSTATLDAATGVYTLTTSVTELGDAAVTTTTELSKEQVAGGTAAKNYMLGLLGLNDSFRYVNEDGVDVLKQGLFEVQAPLTGMALDLETSRQNIESYRDGLIESGISAEEAGQLISAAFAKAEADIRASYARIAALADADSFTRLQQTIYGSGYQQPADSFLYQLVGDRYAIGPGGGPFAPLVQALDLARAGNRAGLEDVYRRTNLNVDKGVFTEEERKAVEEFASALYNQAQQRLIRNNPGGSGDQGAGTSTNTGANDNDGGVDREGINKQISDLQEASKRLNETANAAERLGNALNDAADGLRLYRLGLLTDPSQSPWSIGDQLREAIRQQQDAYLRVQAGGEGAADAAKELQSTTDTVLSLGRQVFGNSAQYNQLFNSSIGLLSQAQDAATNYAALQLAEAEKANVQLGRIAEEIEALRDKLSPTTNGGGGGGGGGGDGGGTGTPTTPTIPGPGQALAFGYTNLGRRVGESADAFIKRVFPAQLTKAGGSDGFVTEQEGYDWSVAQRDPAKLGNLTNAGYFGAALKAGFPGPFTQDAFASWLSPGGTPIDARWIAFITALRAVPGASVPYGYFGYPFAEGGLVQGGIPGVDSVPALLQQGERVFSVPQSQMIEDLAALAANANGRETTAAIERQTALIDQRFARLEQRLAGVERRLEEGNADRGAIRKASDAARLARPAVGRARDRKAA